MPCSPRRSPLAILLGLALVATAALAQSTRDHNHKPARVPPKTSQPTAIALPSALSAQLFYDILLGELKVQTGSQREGIQQLLDVARSTRDASLFQRAVELAMRARSPETALLAARHWKSALPASHEANRTELQLLIVLGRLGEAIEPLRAELAATPEAERSRLMSMIARSFSGASDKALAATVVEQALNKQLHDSHAATAAQAWATVGRMRLAANDMDGAMGAAKKAHSTDPHSDTTFVLALDLMHPLRPEAEAMVRRYLELSKPLPGARLAYARSLTTIERWGDALSEVESITKNQPEIVDSWLLKGMLHVQLRQSTQAETALKRYLRLAEQEKDDETRKRGMAQAQLQLAQLAEGRKDLVAAERWLARIDSPDHVVAAQNQRALLLARQGKVQEARELVRGLPERDENDARAKLQTEVQVLREAKQFQAAYDLLAQATSVQPDDDTLLYDQAMMAEKLNQLDVMEQLLRKLIARKPEHKNAYNALGYSLADRNLRLDEARELILKAVALAPDDVFIADSLGWVEFRLGNAVQAQRILENIYKRRADPEIGAHLGEVLWANGHRERALTIWREALLADPDNETLQATLKRLRVKP